MEGSHIPRPAYGTLDRTAELLARLLSGSEDPDVTALSEAIRAKLGITEPLTKQASFCSMAASYPNQASDCLTFSRIDLAGR